MGTCLMTCYLAYRVDYITTSASALIVMAEWPSGKTNVLPKTYVLQSCLKFFSVFAPPPPPCSVL